MFIAVVVTVCHPGPETVTVCVSSEACADVVAAADAPGPDAVVVAVPLSDEMEVADAPDLKSHQCYDWTTILSKTFYCIITIMTCLERTKLMHQFIKNILKTITCY